jgi:hypothetical protein
MEVRKTEQAAQLFERSLDWLRDHYSEHTFRNESDLVTALWLYMRRRLIRFIRCYMLITRGRLGLPWAL